MPADSLSAHYTCGAGPGSGLQDEIKKLKNLAVGRTLA